MPSGGDLVVEMLKAMPLYCQISERVRQVLAKQGIFLSSKKRLDILSVHDLGELGGVSCAIKSSNSKNVHIMSITNFQFPDKGEIYDKINQYREARIQWLREEDMRNLSLGLERANSPFRLSKDTSDALSKVPRNEPCPCGSGLKYKKCCGRKL
jgi:hypothetical protein